MGGLEDGPCPGMARVGMDDCLREMDRVHRTAGRDLLLRPGDDSVGTGEIDEIGTEFVGGDGVKLSGNPLDSFRSGGSAAGPGRVPHASHSVTCTNPTGGSGREGRLLLSRQRGFRVSPRSVGKSAA